MEANLLDLVEYPMSDQVRIAYESDILVGVHGAGLTHAMSQRPNSALVEIIPNGFNHKGFKNLAKMRGLKYFSTHVSSFSGKIKRANWQEDDVYLETERFLDLMDVAIKSMYNRGTRNDDISWVSRVGHFMASDMPSEEDHLCNVYQLSGSSQMCSLRVGTRRRSVRT